MAGLYKQHFKAIAEILRRNGLRIESQTYGSGFLEHFVLGGGFLCELCGYFKTQNPKFDEAKFKEACLK